MWVYNILMLEHLAATADPPRRVQLKELVPRWQEALPKWRSWLCTQTRQTYQQVAEGIGRPRAVRAVANACAANRLALVIPCHRVIRGDGGLGGYRWGVERKQALLAREQLR